MTAPDKLAGIKPGDRVRVTFEGEMSETSAVHFWPVVTDGMSAPTMWVMPDVHCQPQIERVEPPLKVGDRVRHKGEVGVIVAMSRGFAWVEWSITPSPMTILLSDLERIA